MDFTDDELADARRDIAALLRARNDGEPEREDAILTTAGERGLAAIAKTLLDSHHDELLRLHVAAAVMTADQCARVFGPDPRDLASDLALRARVAKSIADMHDDVLRNE